MISLKKNVFILFLLGFVADQSFAQERLEYAGFIQTDTAIKWAAMYNSILDLTPVNPNKDISKFYLDKLKTTAVAVYREDTTFFKVGRSFSKYEDYLSSIRKTEYSPVKMNWKYDFAENEASNELFQLEQTGCDTCYLNDRFSFMEVKQLLYYKDHRLFARNILLTPLFYTKKQYDSKENTSYFTGSAIAFDAAEKEETIPSSAVFIARTSNQLDFSPYSQTRENKILTNHDYGLHKRIFWDVKKGYLKAFDTERSLVPPFKYLRKDTIENYHSPLIDVPQYDDAGIVLTTLRKRNEINLDSFYMFVLIQDIYFDFDKEKLYSKVIRLIPLQHVFTGVGIDLGMTYYWGINFEPLAEPVKKKTKK